MPSESFIREFFEVFNQRNLDKMEDLFSPDAEFYVPKTQPLIGKNRILQPKSAPRGWPSCKKIFENTTNLTEPMPVKPLFKRARPEKMTR